MIRIVSFGYKHRKPPKALAVFDCRDLRNPHNVPQLKALTGLDKAVSDYVRASPAFELLVDYAISHRGLDEFTLAFGCVGGGTARSQPPRRSGAGSARWAMKLK